jgi:hypothetical protein
MSSAFSPNPYSDFEPSQWSNPYSPYPSSALPFPASYLGWPTNAMGQPIQAPPGMTLNSSPAAAAQTPQQANPQQSAINNAIINQMAQQGMMNVPGGIGGNGRGVYEGIAGTPLNNIPNLRAMNSAAPAPPTPAANNPSGLTSQQYLSLLAHPGNVTSPGFAPQGSSQPLGSGVLQQFLANWNPSKSGPGSGFQQAFAQALKGSG